MLRSATPSVFVLEAFLTFRCMVIRKGCCISYNLYQRGVQVWRWTLRVCSSRWGGQVSECIMTVYYSRLRTGLKVYCEGVL